MCFTIIVITFSRFLGQWALTQIALPPPLIVGWRVRLWVQDIECVCNLIISKKKGFLGFRHDYQGWSCYSSWLVGYRRFWPLHLLLIWAFEVLEMTVEIIHHFLVCYSFLIEFLEEAFEFLTFGSTSGTSLHKNNHWLAGMQNSFFFMYLKNMECSDGYISLPFNEMNKADKW